MKEDEFKALYEDYKNSKFKQQKMNGWRPLPTISCITIIFVPFGVFFILMGIIILIVISQLPEPIDIIYDKNCPKNDKGECSFEITIGKDMKNPLMVYYQIDDFKQNTRAYMDNKKNEKVFDDNFTDWEINEAKINKKVNFPQNYSNWVKINPYSHVRKYWGSILKDFKKDTKLNVAVKLGENFIEERRHLLIIEKSIFGGPKSYFLGSIYIAFGFFCLITSIVFINAYNKFHKKI